MQKTEIKISIVSILFLLFSPINIHAIPINEEIFFDNSATKLKTDSNIIDVDSNFFIENNFKRYLIFGSNSSPNKIGRAHV